MNVYARLIKDVYIASCSFKKCSRMNRYHGGKKLKAYILISTKPGTSLEVIQRIRDRVKETVAADAIFGRYDAVVILEAPALAEINQVVYRIIEKDPNVIRTETSIVLEIPEKQ